ELTRPEAEMLATMVRGLILQTIELLNHPTRPSGWTHSDPRVLQAQGLASGSFPAAFAKVVPRLGGLAERLAGQHASFLDIGVGVGWLAIGMCRAFPALQVVGVDPYEPSLALARRNIAERELEARITLRAQRAEDIDDTAAFDLAWFSVPFVPS